MIFGIHDDQGRSCRISCVSCCWTHILVLTDVGTVFSFGKGAEGCLGHGDEDDQRQPKLIKSLLDKRVVAIATSFSFSLVLTDEGEVFSFGCGLRGQLGHGDREKQLKPKLIDALRGVRVVAIAIGCWASCSCMVLTDECTMLSFGSGRQRQLGHGDEEDQLVPKIIEALRGVRVVAMSPGTECFMVLTSDGTVLMLDPRFGNDGGGKFIDVSPWCGRAVAISAGNMNSMVLTDEGKALGFESFWYRRPEDDKPDFCELNAGFKCKRVEAITHCSERVVGILADTGKALVFGVDADGAVRGNEVTDDFSRKCSDFYTPAVQVLNDLKRPVGSYGHSDHAQSSIAADGVAPLCAIFGHSSDATKEHVAEVLSMLSTNAENRSVIASQGGIRSLVALLSNGTCKAKRHAVAALANLADDNMAAIAEADSLALLAKHFGASASSDEPGNRWSAIALKHLEAHYSG